MIKKVFPILLFSVIILGTFSFIFFNNKSSNNEELVRQTEIQKKLNILNNPTPTSKPDLSTKNVEISLTATGFDPKEITIDKNTKVIWINKSEKIATVDSNPHPVHTNHPEINLGIFEMNKKLEYIFTTPGRYGYHNHFLEEEVGTIIVK